MDELKEATPRAPKGSLEAIQEAYERYWEAEVALEEAMGALLEAQSIHEGCQAPYTAKNRLEDFIRQRGWD